jgi:hypothetical protein
MLYVRAVFFVKFQGGSPSKVSISSLYLFILEILYQDFFNGHT